MPVSPVQSVEIKVKRMPPVRILNRMPTQSLINLTKLQYE